MRLKRGSVGLVGAVLIMLTGCTNGVRNLGSARLLNGDTVEFVQVKTAGQSGPDVTAVMAYRYNGSDSRKDGEWSATSDGLVEQVLSGSGAAAAGSLGLGLPAALLRPAKTNVNQQGGGANSNSSAQGGGGGAGGDSYATGGSAAVSGVSAESNAKSASQSAANAAATATATSNNPASPPHGGPVKGKPPMPPKPHMPPTYPPGKVNPPVIVPHNPPKQPGLGFFQGNSQNIDQ